MDLLFTRQLARSIPNGAVFLFNRNLEFILAEGPVLAKHGYDKTAMEGQRIVDVLPAASHEKLMPLYQQTLEGQSQQMTLETEGGMFWTRFEPLVDNGQVRAGMLLIVEVSELERQRRELLDYFYILSHDIKSPLSSILGLLEVYRLENTASERDHLIDMVEQTAHKSLTFISALLDQKITPIDLPVMVAEIIQKTTHQFSTRPIVFSSEFKHRKGKFYSVPSLVRSVLENLLGNAYKYYDPQKPAPFVRLTTWEEPPLLYIAIADNGRGIPEAELQHIFRKQYQLDQQSDGHGVGLYLVQQNLKKLGGTIRATSEVGVGTTFTVALPLQELPPDYTPETAAAATE